jgi:hypothetical protein
LDVGVAALLGTDTDPTEIVGVLALVGKAAIWIAYFSMSQRVKQTFVR